MQELEDFLKEAKMQTYANASTIPVAPTRKSSHDYEYTRDNMTYHDTYFGTTNFIGEEVVYVDNKIFWAMNYYGNTLDENLSEEVMDNALRPALMRVGEDGILPLRGPKTFQNGEYTYNFTVEGDLTYFKGMETIYKNDEKIFELICNGGLIK